MIAPMLARPGALPAQDGRWAYELKWDGVRAVGYVDDGGLRLMTRNDQDVSAAYPEVAALSASLGGRPCVLDGELVALDDRGVPSFGALQRRMHVRDPGQVRRLVAQVPVTYLLFDLLRLDGADLLDRPWRGRRELLESLELQGPAWSTPPTFLGDGAEVLAASKQQGLEGVVAKRVDAPYEPGRRSDSWIKVKNLRTQEVLIGGWQPGAGRRSGGIGSLLLGVPGPSGLEYAGHVGTGFTAAMLADLGDLLRPLGQEASPFATPVPRPQVRDARWVAPRLVGEVVFTEWTSDGRLRHPAWRGLRPDKSPSEVVRES